MAEILLNLPPGPTVRLRKYASLTTDCVLSYRTAHTVKIVRSGTAYYVAAWGNNVNPGTFDAPFRTADYGATKLQPGDSLIFLEQP